MISEKQQKLGEALVRANVLTAEQLKRATEAASKENAPSLIVGLLDQGFLTFKVFEKFVQGTMGVKSAIISSHDLNLELVSKIGLQTITSNLIFPISLRDNKGTRQLALGMVDPLDTRIIEKIEREQGCKVVPILISLPDFKEAMKKNIPRISGKQIDLKSDKVTEESFVLVQGNPYDENVIKLSEQEARPGTNKPSRPPPAITPRRPNSEITSLPPTDNWNEFKLEGEKTGIRLGPGHAFGQTGLKFREEVLAKLDLDPGEVRFFTQDNYTRDSLASVIGKVSQVKLQNAFKKANAEAKVEALLNLLVQKGLVTKEDVLIETAISFIFSEVK